jgi:type IV secretory pathway TraG/TraD family ATPase VirD4
MSTAERQTGEEPPLLARLRREGRRRPLVMPQGDRTVIGYGQSLHNPAQHGYLSIRDQDRSGHVGCFGTTRVGKTRLMENLIEQDIAKGYSVVVFDPKGDAELFSRMVQVAAQTNRLDELLMITPIFPDYSTRLNPLASYYMQEELVNHIVSGIKAKEDYFIAIATEVSQVVVAGLIKLAEFRGERPRLTFEAIWQRVGFDELKRLREALALVPGAEAICHAIDKITQNPALADFFAKVSSSLRTMLSALTYGATGRIIGTADENLLIDRLELGQPVIAFVNTGSLLTRRASHIIAKVLLSMIQSLVGRVFASGRRLTPPLCLHLDEGYNVLYHDIQDLFSKGGGAGCWVHLYAQSMAQIAEAIGKEAAQSLMDNINTWIYFLLNHPETAQLVEDAAPRVTRRDSVIVLGGGLTGRLIEVPLIRSADVLQLPKRTFLLRSYGQWYRGMTLDTNPLWVRVQFPTIQSSRLAAAQPSPAAAAPSHGAESAALAPSMDETVIPD